MDPENASGRGYTFVGGEEFTLIKIILKIVSLNLFKI